MNGRIYKILIIDDSAEDRVTFRYYLEKNKKFRYEFLEAEMGDEGVKICLAEQPDCVLLDYILPDSNGLAVLKTINPDPFNPVFPVILLTGAGDESLVVKVMKQGAQDYLVKGEFSHYDLHRTVHHAIEMVGLRREGQSSEEKLKANEELLKIGTEVADFAICEIDYTANINRFTKEAARLFGLGEEEMNVSREAVHATFHPDERDEMAKLIEESLNPDGDGWFAREHRIILPNGKVRWLNVRKQIFFDRTANPARPVRGILAAQDITARKTAEELLRESETRYHSLFELAAVGIARADGASGQFQEVNDEFCRITGYSREELLSLDFPNLTHPDDREADRENRRKLAHGEQTQATYTKRYIRKDGQTIWVRITASMVRDETGKIEFGVSVVEDITERKQAEENLRQSEARLRLALQGARAGAWTFDLKMQTTSWTDEMFTIYGQPRGSVPTFEEWVNGIHPDFRDQIRREFVERLSSRQSAVKPSQYASEFIYFRPDGEERWINNHSNIFYDEAGNPQTISGVVFDITQRKLAEESVRDSEERLRVATDAAEMYAWEVDVKTQTIKYGDNHARVLGFALPADFAGIQKIIHPDDRAESLATFENALAAGKDFEGESRLVNPSTGAIVWICTNGVILKDGAGNPSRIFGVVQNITRRKLAEEGLLENQRFTESIIETAPSVIYTFNLKTGIPTYLTDQAATVLGYSFDEVRDKQPDFLQTFMHPEDAKSAQKHFRQLSRTSNGKIFEFEYRMQHKSGEWRWFRSRDRVFKRDENGTAEEILGIALDVTERKKATEEVRESEERMRLATEATAVGIWEWNVITNQIRWNARMFRIYGIAPTEGGIVPYTAWSESVLPEELSRQEDLLQETLRQGGQSSREFRIRRNDDGQIRYIQSVETVRLNAAGQPEGVIGTNLDITERIQRERNLAFLADLHKDFAPLLNADEILRVAGERIAAYLNLTNCSFVEINEAMDTAHVVHDQHAAGAVNLAGVYPMKDFHSAEERAEMLAGRAIVINDTGAMREPEAAARFDALGIRALLTAPYVSDGRWRFCLCAMRDKSGIWSESEVELLTEIAARIYTRIERARAEENLWTSNRQLNLLAQTSRKLIVGEKSEAEILQTVFDDVAETLETEFFFNFMAGDEPETLRLLTSGGLSQAQKDFFATIKFGEYLCGTVAQKRESRVVEKLQECEYPEADALRQSGIKAYAGFPLVAQSELIGTVAFATRNREHFREGELQLIQTVCDQVAITLERARAEEKLRESEERFRSLFDSIDEGFCIIEMIFDAENKPLDYRFVQANPAMERLTGLKDALGKTARELVPDLEEFWFETYGKVALTGKPARFENEAVPMNRWFEVYASRVGNSTNRVAVVFNNITERKLAEQEREETFKREQLLRRQAEDANRAKDEFLAMLSHELRSPLNAMLGWATMLNNGGLNEKMQKQAVSVIERNVRLQNSLIEDLLDASRIISGKMRLETAKISFVFVVQNAIDSARPAADAKKIKLEMTLDAAADEMNGDSFRLQQVIGNLLTNAIKFTPENGAVEVALKRDGDTARLTIKDTGIGIGAELLPHIFKRFQQADGSSKRQYGGLGLGLTIVKHLAEMHGGCVSAASDGAGKGATFTVKLPLNITSGVMSTPPSMTQQNKHTGDHPAQPLKNIKLLVVDDDPDALELTRFVLAEKGTEVICAGSAEEALRRLESNKFDLLISDLGMAGTDGYDLIRKIRANENPEIAALPAIALTGYVSAEDRGKVLAAGFQTHLPKPLDFDKLFAVVMDLIEK